MSKRHGAQSTFLGLPANGAEKRLPFPSLLPGQREFVSMDSMQSPLLLYDLRRPLRLTIPGKFWGGFSYGIILRCSTMQENISLLQAATRKRKGHSRLTYRSLRLWKAGHKTSAVGTGSVRLLKAMQVDFEDDSQAPQVTLDVDQ